ncbi:glycosyltransferase [Patescibacteria group bacterium]|nr:glycosyltransferase [Patescibacteria group bacterium]
MKNQPPIAVVVIPTYNEAGSIGKMIDYLETKTFPTIKNWQLKVLVVDGHSPDGTGKIVSEKAKKYTGVHLFEETSKDGIGAAYLKGFKYAMQELKADAVFEFDADFQHPPEMIVAMLKEIDNGYDYVIGSRKIAGGSNPKGWGFKRVFFSEAGGLTARFLLFFPFKKFFTVTDPTTGLKVTRVKGFLDHLNLDFKHLYTRSFAYKMQLLFETLKLGAKYKEVPLEFQVRTTDQSKIEQNAIIDGIRVCALTRWHDTTTQKFIKFGVVGFIGLIINIVFGHTFKLALASTTLAVSVVNGVANGLAAELSIISNFIWNNLWTFSQEKITTASSLVSKFVTFNISSVITGILIPSTVIALLTALFGDHFLIYQLIAIFFLTIPLNWLVYNKIIWNKKTK